MKQQSLSALTLALLNSLAQSSKVLILNDIHLDRFASGISQPGHETSPDLLNEILQDAFDEESMSGAKYEAILCIGDLVKHGLAVEEGSATNNWEEQKTTMREALKAISDVFPGVPILPVIGNNDATYHNQAPSAAQADQYYTDLFDIWFNEILGNEGAHNTHVETTFKQGGWYMFELDDVMILNLNGMYPFYSNHQAKEKASEMIDWVSETLDANPGKKFMTQSHVYFGDNFYKSLEVLWDQSYTNDMLKVLDAHKNDMMVALGAHTHSVKLMAPESAVVPNLDIVEVISPAVSPVYNNNPGYGIFTFSAQNGVEDLKFRFLQTQDSNKFIDYDVQGYTGMDLNNASSVRTYINGLFNDSNAYAEYISRNIGLPNYSSLQNTAVFNNYYNDVYANQQAKMLCSISYFDTSLYPSQC